MNPIPSFLRRGTPLYQPKRFSGEYRVLAAKGQGLTGSPARTSAKSPVKPLLTAAQADRNIGSLQLLKLHRGKSSAEAAMDQLPRVIGFDRVDTFILGAAFGFAIGFLMMLLITLNVLQRL